MACMLAVIDAAAMVVVAHSRRALRSLLQHVTMFRYSNVRRRKWRISVGLAVVVFGVLSLMQPQMCVNVSMNAAQWFSIDVTALVVLCTLLSASTYFAKK